MSRRHVVSSFFNFLSSQDAFLLFLNTKFEELVTWTSSAIGLHIESVPMLPCTTRSSIRNTALIDCYCCLCLQECKNRKTEKELQSSNALGYDYFSITSFCNELTIWFPNRHLLLLTLWCSLTCSTHIDDCIWLHTQGFQLILLNSSVFISKWTVDLVRVIIILSSHTLLAWMNSK